MRKDNLLMALSLLLALTASHANAATVRYSITDLGTTTTPVAINNNGQIAGSMVMADGHDQAFIYQNGTLTGLGTFGGTDSVALGINSSGNVVGNVRTYSGDTHGFLYKDGFVDLFGAAGLIEAKGVNDSDVVLGLINGYYMGSSPARQTVLYDNGLLTNISLADWGYGWSSYPIAINNVGQAVYFQYVCGDCDNSYLYSEGTLKEYVWFVATDLNDFGHLVGYRTSYSWDQDELGLWYHNEEETVVNERPGSDCYPQAINNKGQIVGTLLYDDVSHAFLYSGSVMTDLNSLIPAGSDWRLVEAVDINDKGQIVGFGMFQGESHAYLLEPWRQVELDIMLNGQKDLSSVNAHRPLTAAIISSPDFDAATVKPETIKVSGALVRTVGRKQKYVTDLKDINRDGLKDLVFHFPADELVLDGTSGQVVLEAETFDGQKIHAEADLTPD